VPLGRLGRMEEHAWLVALLASPAGRAFAGSVVTIDGARDNWFGPWPPPALADEEGTVPTEARRPSPAS
jgi:citronellol/citronellal dehydrogenase